MMFEQERKAIVGLAMVVIIAIAFLWVSNEDYKHEVEMENQYREMVCAGHWPDYWQTNPNCKGES